VNIGVDDGPQGHGRQLERRKDRRQDENTPVVCAQANRLRQTVDVARNNGVEYLFIDTFDSNDDSALSASRVADLVLVPNRRNIVEVETLPQVKDLLRLAGSPPAFVLLNGFHPNAGQATLEEVRHGLKEMFGLVVCPVYLCQRNVYAEAMTTGKVPQELETDGRAMGAKFGAIQEQLE
jgi:chromosome partitioning protein